MLHLYLNNQPQQLVMYVYMSVTVYIMHIAIIDSYF